MMTKAGGASSLVTYSIRSRLQLSELDRDNFFEVAYEHFAEAGVWKLYPEVPEVLEQLRPRFQLAVISNFDGRLRFILQHLGISKYFSHVFISSELGADKPDPEIFRRALKIMHLNADEVLHVGDDPERDWKAAKAAGLLVFRLDRPRNSLRDLLTVAAALRAACARLTETRLQWVGRDSNPEPTPKAFGAAR